MTSDEVTFAITRRDALRRAGLAASLPLLTLALPARAETPSGRLEMEEVEISLPLSAGWGHGTLFYEGTHPSNSRGWASAAWVSPSVKPMAMCSA